MNTTQTNWSDVRKTAKSRYDELIRLGDTRHSSFVATEALEYASELHGVQDHGVEGFTESGSYRHGLTYLNMGDTYDTTVIFNSRSERFTVGCWGDIVERYPNRYE